ncbi:MAG TPA: class I SAM-dependent methyltransferase [Planctomycetota bacterium]|nr:class I SAM-dependent methyltransferase [Planctomycetota bacterium]
MTEPLSYDWADVYDDYASGLPGDVEFYVAEAQKTDGEVLEIACGTGRILIPIAEAGHRITGLDVTPTMLTVCRRKVAALPQEVAGRITLHEADMRDFDLGKQFPLVICPYRAFLHNLTVEDQLAALACIRRHLTRDGRFVMNVFDPKLELISPHLQEENASDYELYRSYFDSTTGNQIDVYEKRWYDPTGQVVHCDSRFVEKLPSGKEKPRGTKTLTLRWVYRWEMEHLFARAGFEVVELLGNFDRDAFRYGREQIWIVRRNPGD